MMRQPRPKAFKVLAGLIAGLLLAGRSVRAWNGTGHEAVALVAWDQMTDAERAVVTDTLKAHPHYDRDLLQHLDPGSDPGRHAFLEAGTWPDYVRSQTNPLNRTENHPTWHYVDYPYERDGKTGPLPAEQWDGHSDPANLLQALQKVEAEIKDPKVSADRKAIDYCWVMHLIGDVHQPCHAVSLYSDRYPVGDKGSNAVILKTPLNTNMNLHAIWDGLEGQSYNYDVIRKVADRVEKDHPPEQFKDQLTKADPKDWAAESFALAKSAVYQDGKLVGATPDEAKAHPEQVPPMPVDYQRNSLAVADSQVALAGYRLAAVLKELGKAQPAGQ